MVNWRHLDSRIVLFILGVPLVSGWAYNQIKKSSSSVSEGSFQVGTNEVQLVRKDGFADSDYVFLKDKTNVVFYAANGRERNHFNLDGYKVSYDRVTGPYTITELPKTQRVELSKLEKQ